jgi:hypothetical protein
MHVVFDLHHSVVRDGRRDRKGIGVYTSQSLAEAVMARLKDKPGFRDPAGAFGISRCIVNQAYLRGGLDVQAEAISATGETLAAYELPSLHCLFNIHAVDAPETDDDFVIIGYYSSEALANDDAKHLKLRPEFGTSDRKFEVHIRWLNQDGWVDGFISDGDFDLPAWMFDKAGPAND